MHSFFRQPLALPNATLAQGVSIPGHVADPQGNAVLHAPVSLRNSEDKNVEGNVLAPDPAQRVLIRDDALDANPGRPGAALSIPGLPIETASGGIKAPQYFPPGAAGDHGEPIAQYIQVRCYLLPNNLSANAHGNGYADPNILVPSVIESVHTFWRRCRITSRPVRHGEGWSAHDPCDLLPHRNPPRWEYPLVFPLVQIVPCD